MHPMLGRLQAHESRLGMMRKDGDGQYRIKCGALRSMAVGPLTTHNVSDSCDGPIIFDCFLCTRCGAEICHRCHDDTRLSSNPPPACVAISKVRERSSGSLLSRLKDVHHKGHEYRPLSRLLPGEVDAVLAEVNTAMLDAPRPLQPNARCDALRASADVCRCIPELSPGQVPIFRILWAMQYPVVVHGIQKKLQGHWSPQSFAQS